MKYYTNRYFLDTENYTIITEDSLHSEYLESDYPGTFADYIRNATDKNGFLEEYQYIENRGIYRIFRRVENFHGYWIAQNTNTGEVFSITYDMAGGYAPIRPTETEILAKRLGEILLP